MGWSNSWIAIRGARKEDVLAHLGLAETGQEILPGSRGGTLSCREFPGGWMVVFSERFDWADRPRTLDLSKLGLVVSCQFEDKVMMASVARCARAGAELWSIAHDNETSIYRLDITGEPPAEFETSRKRLFEEQAAAGGEDSSTDYIHDVPLEVAHAICGYRHDKEQAAFTVLKAMRRSPGQTPDRRPSLLDKILAPLKPKVWPDRY